MSIIFARLHSVKTANRTRTRPSAPFVVLFDPSNLPVRPFAGRLPRKPVVVATPEFSAIEMRRIDQARREALNDATGILDAAGAEDYAAGEAEKVAARIRSAAQLRATQEARRNLKPYTARDVAFWAAESNQGQDWDRLACEAETERRMTELAVL